MRGCACSPAWPRSCWLTHLSHDLHDDVHDASDARSQQAGKLRNGCACARCAWVHELTASICVHPLISRNPHPHHMTHATAAAAAESAPPVPFAMPRALARRRTPDQRPVAGRCIRDVRAYACACAFVCSLCVNAHTSSTSRSFLMARSLLNTPWMWTGAFVFVCVCG